MESNGQQVQVQVGNKVLTSEQIARYKRIFNLFDINKDGVLDARELGAVSKVLGYQQSKRDVVSMLKRLDIDKNRHMDFDEFLRAVSGRLPEQSEIQKKIDFEPEINYLVPRFYSKPEYDPSMSAPRGRRQKPPHKQPPRPHYVPQEFIDIETPQGNVGTTVQTQAFIQPTQNIAPTNNVAAHVHDPTPQHQNGNGGQQFEYSDQTPVPAGHVRGNQAARQAAQSHISVAMKPQPTTPKRPAAVMKNVVTPPGGVPPPPMPGTQYTMKPQAPPPAPAPPSPQRQPPLAVANPNNQHYQPPHRPAQQAATPTSPQPQPQFIQPQSVLSPPHQPPMPQQRQVPPPPPPAQVYQQQQQPVRPIPQHMAPGGQQQRANTPQRQVRVITPQQFSRANTPQSVQNLHGGQTPQSELFWTPPSSPTRQPVAVQPQPVQQAVPHPGSGTHAPAMVANPLDTENALGATDIAKHRDAMLAFAKYDLDGNGFISRNEAEQVLQSVLGFTPAQTNEFLMACDVNYDNKLCYSEFVNFYSKVQARKNAIDEAFMKFDTGSKGYVTYADARKILSSFMFSDGEIERLIKMHDTNQDGVLQYDEFRTFWTTV